MKKTIAALLSALILLPALFACAENPPPRENTPDATNAPDGVDTTADENAGGDAERIAPDLPTEDFGGYEFTFLSHLYTGDDWVTTEPRELVAETENSDPINDAVYARNTKIMEQYNFKMRMFTIADEVGTLNKSVKAGDDLYDAAVIFNNNIPNLIMAGTLLQIDSLPYIDLSKPWWDSAALSMGIGGKNYMLGGDILILDNEATNILLFNKDMMVNFGMDLPYQLVLDGKWTLDVLNEYIRQVSQDLNGDGKFDMTDQYGLSYFNDSAHAFLVGGGGSFALKDENDIPYMTLTSERNLRVMDKIMDVLYNPGYTLNFQKYADTADLTLGQAYVNVFSEGRSLFIWMRMRGVENFRGMDAAFGIVPIPKFEEAQDSYHSVVNPYTGVMMCVPKTCQNPERTSIILEALAAESRYTLQPAYYDVVLQRKFARDEESRAMLDIIFNSRVYDIGAGYSFGSIFIDLCQQVIQKDSRDIISFYDKRSAKCDTAIAKVVNIFNELG